MQQLRTIALIVLGACTPSKQAPSTTPATGPFGVIAQMQVTQLSVPHGPRELALCPPGLVLVPVGGGIALAGWDGWLSPPDQTPITSIACDANGDLTYLRAGALWRRDHGDAQATKLVELPSGTWHLASTANRGAWIWGRAASGTSVVFRLSPARGVTRALATARPIGAVAEAGIDAAIVAVDRTIVLIDANGAIHPLREMPRAPDGLATLPDGGVVVSDALGLTGIASDGTTSVVAAGLHGPMAISYLSLFVLSTERDAVFRLAP